MTMHDGDQQLTRWLLDERLPFCLVATKIDKLGPSKREPALRALLSTLGLPDSQPRVACSSHTGEGRDTLLGWIEHALAAADDNGNPVRASRHDRD